MKRFKNPLPYLEDAFHPEEVSSIWAGVVLAFFVGIFFACYVNFNSLPAPNLADDLTLPEFNARNAREYLHNLTKFGPKVAGSSLNEEYAVDYLLSELEKIRSAKHVNMELDIDVQVANGSLYIAYQTSTMSATYQGVQNVVVRLRNALADPEKSLLINSHYDTVAVSPGGGDAGTMISVMLETLRVLSTMGNYFKHGIIFLFNGCEENALQGAHAFITQHKWANTTATVLNLDSAGNGGREIMFQATQGYSWLMKYYKRNVPHPFASALGEELFQAELIPSDTDFRIFRDYGNIPGMDLAYISNGYVYHTKHDTADRVPDGTLQHTGDNLLALSKALANAYELEYPHAYRSDDVVFFDVWNLFMVYYNKNIAQAINLVVMSICLISQSIWYYVQWRRRGSARMILWRSLGLYVTQLISLVIACGATVALGFFYDAINRSMRWYNNTFMIFLLYVCPLYFLMAIGPAIFRRFNRRMRPWHATMEMCNLNSWLLIIILVVAMSFDIRSGFMVMVPLMMYTLSLIFQGLGRTTGWKLVLHYLWQVIPFSFFSSWTITAFATFIPIAGRSGTNNNPELIISIFAIGLGILLAGFLLPTISMFRSPIGVSLVFAVLWLIGVVMMFTPISFPYAHDVAPQRQRANHIHRTFYDLEGTIRREHSAFFVRGSDRNKQLTGNYLNLSSAISGETECNKEWLCGLPLLYNTDLSSIHLFEAQKPGIPGVESDLRLVDTVQTSSTSQILTFQLSCDNNCGIYISPAEGITMTKWSLFEPIEESFQTHKNQWLYFISAYNLFVDRPDLEFWVELDTSGSWRGGNKRLNMGISAHYTANRDSYSDEYEEFLDQFPDWTAVDDWISTFKSYEF